MVRFAVTPFPAFLVLGFVIAASEGAPAPTKTLQKIHAASGLPAIGYIVLQDGQVKDVQAVGLRRSNATIPVTIHDKWHIGSCGKAMTATMLARLVEKGVLRWSSTLRSVFGKTHPDLANVTLAQLLSHTAGLVNNPDLTYLVCIQYKTLPKQRACALRIMLRREPWLPPGTKFHYSNSGYVVAAAMAERITNKSFEILMREELFGPLGMRGVGYGSPARGNRDTQPWGHTTTLDGKLQPKLSDLPLGFAPAGLMHMPLQDWVKFASVHLQGGKSGFLRQKTFDRLHTPVLNGYAFGWNIDNESEILNGTNFLFHAGSNGLWSAVAVLVPEADTALLVAANLRDKEKGDAALMAVVKNLVDRFVVSRIKRLQGNVVSRTMPILASRWEPKKDFGSLSFGKNWDESEGCESW